MRTPLYLIVIGVCLVLFLGTVHADASQQQILFDDFVTSQLSPNWIYPGSGLNQGNITQSGGYMTLTSARGLLTGASCPGADCNLANTQVQSLNSIVDSNMPNGQFFFTAWKMIPFNLTSTGATGGSTAVRNAELKFGFARSGFTGFGGFGFDMGETDQLSNAMNVAGQKQWVSLFLQNMTTSAIATTCFQITTSIDVAGDSACGFGSTNYQGVVYTGKNGVIDLNSIHVFEMEMKLFQPGQGNSWIAFQVDNNGFINMTQTACGCINTSGGANTFAPLFPYMILSYCAGTSTPAGGGQGCGTSSKVNQSVGTSVDYILIDNYVPASIPVGQILVSSATPPTVLPQPGTTGTITDFIQFEANSISPGNLYAGGMLLTIIVSGTVFACLFGLSRRWNISVKNYGLFFTMFVLVLSFFFFIASVLPIWIPAMMVLITVGIAFGVIKTGNASGGLVPD